MNVYPLDSLSLEEAIQTQFRLVDIITQHFNGEEILTLGDLGVKRKFNQPKYTRKVEQVLADFFGAEDAVLVRGAGTNAIRLALYSLIKESRNILVHKAPIYPTTEITLNMFKSEIYKVDYNNLDEVEKCVSTFPLDVVIIQTTRQKIDDHYQLKSIITSIKKIKKDLPILVDDNYAVLKTHEYGVMCGADISCFSMFKLLGPEGVGCIIGKSEYIEKIRKDNYSGGGQIQGFEANEVLRGLIYAPVALAISANVVQEVVDRLNNNEVCGVRRAFVVNAQSKVIIVELTKPVSDEVVEKAMLFGSLPNPVGAESKYEFSPLFYRVSQTFRNSIPGAEKYMVRINPNRAGANTVINILQKSLNEVQKNNEDRVREKNGKNDS